MTSSPRCAPIYSGREKEHDRRSLRTPPGLGVDKIGAGQPLEIVASLMAKEKAILDIIEELEELLGNTENSN